MLFAACVSLTFLNSRTIIGGLELWGPSSKLGLRPPRDPRASKRFQTFASMLLATRQDSGDGLVELLSIGSTSGYIRAATVRSSSLRSAAQFDAFCMRTTRVRCIATVYDPMTLVGKQA